MEQLNKKEIHQLAMQEVGNFLKTQGYEFLGVNSDMKQSPQFVCVKKKLLYFIVVSGCLYPNSPKKYEYQRIELDNPKQVVQITKSNNVKYYFFVSS